MNNPGHELNSRTLPLSVDMNRYGHRGKQLDVSYMGYMTRMSVFTKFQSGCVNCEAPQLQSRGTS